MPRKILFLLWALLAIQGLPRARAQGSPAEQAPVRELRLEPSSVGVPLGHARLSVEPLVRAGDRKGLSAGYKVDVSPLRLGSEAGKLNVAVTEDDLRRLTAGHALEFSGQATSTEGNVSRVHGTATPASGEAGAIKVRVEGKRGTLVFHTTYRLAR